MEDKEKVEKAKQLAADEQKRIEDKNYKGPRTLQEQLERIKPKVSEHRKSLAKRDNVKKIFDKKHPNHAERQAANQNYVNDKPYSRKSRRKPLGKKR